MIKQGISYAAPGFSEVSSLRRPLFLEGSNIDTPDL